jgi:hypothetical protein
LENLLLILKLCHILGISLAYKQHINVGLQFYRSITAFFIYKQYLTITVEEHYHNKQTTALANGPVIWDGSYPKMALAGSFQPV